MDYANIFRMETYHFVGPLKYIWPIGTNEMWEKRKKKCFVHLLNIRADIIIIIEPGLGPQKVFTDGKYILCYSYSKKMC